MFFRGAMLGIEPGSLTSEAGTIPWCQPDPKLDEGVFPRNAFNQEEKQLLPLLHKENSFRSILN